MEKQTLRIKKFFQKVKSFAAKKASKNRSKRKWNNKDITKGGA